MSSAGSRSPVGQLLGEPFGDYILLRKLATGGMAEVFLARRRSALPGFAKLVAVKRMLPHLAEDPEFITMFLDEARTASHLNHPNIVQIFDIGEAMGTLYLGMEYLEGVSIMTLLSRNIDRRAAQVLAGTQRFLPATKDDRPLDPLCAAAICVQACEGLHYAHELTLSGEPMALVHRDVSPQNLMLTFGGVVKVLDFGIAKAAGRASVTRAGELKGKIRYMAPEQFLFHPVDRRTDVYALGVVLYELATATRAFSGEDWEIVRQIQQAELPPAQRVRAEVPTALQAVIGKAMALSPEDRYESAAALGEALSSVMRELGKVLTPADLAQVALRQFGDERLDLAPFMSGEQMVVPRPREVRLSGPSPGRDERGGESEALQAQTQAYGQPTPLVGWGVEPCNTGAVGSAPPAPQLGPLLHCLLSLGAHFRPRHFWVYPTMLGLLLVVALTAVGQSLGQKRRTSLIGPSPPVALRPAPVVSSRVYEAQGAGHVTEPVPDQTAPRTASERVVAPGGTQARRPVPRPARAIGYLVLDSKPTWARVYARGQLLGQTPIVRRPLPIGATMLKVVNGQSHAQKQVQVFIRRGEVTTTRVQW